MATFQSHANTIFHRFSAPGAEGAGHIFWELDIVPFSFPWKFLAQTATLTVQPQHFHFQRWNRGNMNSRMVRNLKLVLEVPTSRKNWARRSPQSWVAQRQVGSFNWRFHAFKQCKCNPSLPSNSRKNWKWRITIFAEKDFWCFIFSKDWTCQKSSDVDSPSNMERWQVGYVFSDKTGGIQCMDSFKTLLRGFNYPWKRYMIFLRC